MSVMDEGRGSDGARRGRVAAPGHERHVNACRHGIVDRVDVGPRYLPASVKQRAVDVDADQADHGGAPVCPVGVGYYKKDMRLDEFQGVNAGYVLELYERYRQHPESIDPETRKAFEAWTPPSTDVARMQPVSGDANIQKIVAAASLADCIRRYGHLAAHIDPLGSEPVGDPSLSPAAHGITDADLRALPASLVDGPVAESSANAFEAIETLRRIYCSTIGFDYAHIFVPEEREWLRHAAESGRFLPPMDPTSVEAVLDRITQVDVFERFLQRTFPGKTRFSVEGLDLLVPILDEILCGAADHGARHAVLGMAHRGRLNVLAHVLDKPYAQILAEFKDPIAARSFRTDLGFRGDVKYHAGARTAAPRGQMYVSMAPNPSHLEAVDPVVEGMARAAGTRADERGAVHFDSAVTLPILIHGDAAFPGQGIVAETLNLSRLGGYEHRRHDSHHREQPTRVHGNAGRIVQHQLRERPRAWLQDPDRARERRRSGRVPGSRAAGVGIPRAVRPRLPDRSRRLPPLRAQRRRRAGVHTAADLQDGRIPSNRPRDLGAHPR